VTASLAERLADLPEQIRRELLELLYTPEEIAALQHDWGFWGRPEQQEPEQPWSTWYIETGRGFGKTRTASELTHKKVNAGHVRRGALVHRTAGDVREVIVEGETGIMATAKPGKLPKYEPSKRRLTWPNGTIFTTFSAEEPDELRGPTHDFGWGDEFATWKAIAGVDGLTAFDNLRFSMRGTNNPAGPQLVLTTTPKRVTSVKKLHEDVANELLRIVVTHGSLKDNIGNLDPVYVAQILAKYAGTALGEQEIEGKLARTVEGALFTEAMFEASRIRALSELPELGQAIVSVDPSAGDGSGDECGIVVTALSLGTMPTVLQQGGLTVVQELRHGYVLEDASMSGPPDAWADKVCEVAAKYGATTVVAEGNQGHMMVSSLIKARNASLRVVMVHARQGKEARAQPCAGLFAQKRWHLVGEFGELEDQCTTWVPGKGQKSPDRLDAMVWGQRHLEPTAVSAPTSTASAAEQHIPRAAATLTNPSGTGLPRGSELGLRRDW
jgi:phage terminase large subunit-like protein